MVYNVTADLDKTGNKHSSTKKRDDIVVVFVCESFLVAFVDASLHLYESRLSARPSVDPSAEVRPYNQLFSKPKNEAFLSCSLGRPRNIAKM